MALPTEPETVPANELASRVEEILAEGFTNVSLRDDGGLIFRRPRGRPRKLRNEATSKLLIEMPTRLKESLGREANRRKENGEQCSMSQIVREACERYLSAESSPDTQR